MKRSLQKRFLIAFVLLLLAALAIFAWTSKVQTRNRLACLNNLRVIDGTLVSVALAGRHYRGDTIPEAEWISYLKDGQIPACPSGGRYVIPKVGGTPACSFHGDPFAPDGEFYGAPCEKELRIPERPSQ